MNKLTIIHKDGTQQTEPAIWENANDSTVHAKFLMKHIRSIHLIRINPLDGTKPINIVREEKN